MAQNILPGRPTVTAPVSLSKTAVTALQNSLGKAAAAIAPMELTTSPAIPAPPPAPEAPNVVPNVAPSKASNVSAALKKVASVAFNAGATEVMASDTAPVSGRGIRNPVYNRLKGQTTGNVKIDEIIISAATRHGIEPLFLYSVMSQESAFNHQATSPKGARGLMQLMPQTAARFGVRNIYDPEQNIHAGARYLRFLLDTFDGDISLALAGYNAGEGAVRKYGYNVPPYRETIDYVRKIKRRYTDLSSLAGY